MGTITPFVISMSYQAVGYSDFGTSVYKESKEHLQVVLFPMCPIECITFGFQLLHCSSNECNNETWSTFVVLPNRGTLRFWFPHCSSEEGNIYTVLFCEYPIRI